MPYYFVLFCAYVLVIAGLIRVSIKRHMARFNWCAGVPYYVYAIDVYRLHCMRCGILSWHSQAWHGFVLYRPFVCR